MKQLLAIVLASAALTVFAAEPTTAPAPTAEKPKTEMKLAKKKADKDAEAKAAKDATKSQPAKKAEAPKK